MHSIRQRLLLWLLAALLTATAMAAVAVYRQARAEANTLFDYQLQQIAHAFPNEGLNAVPTPRVGDARSITVIQIWDRAGIPLYLSDPYSPPLSADVGYSDMATPQGAWRVYTGIVGNYIVQVSQLTNARHQLAARTALRTIAPLLLLLPALGALVWVVVGRGLRPLQRVAAQVSALSPRSLAPLPNRDLPDEVRPLVDALNGLLVRLRDAADRERAFIADAAHELRTPLTAIGLQAELAERAPEGAERAAAAGALKAGIARATRLVQQLLTLARNEPQAVEGKQEPVDLAGVARDVISGHAAIADGKGVEIGLAGDVAAIVEGDAEALHTLLGNLVDNAVRYTPAGGSVDVAVRAAGGAVQLIVEDTGPGIPKEARERVFDRFYRHEAGAGTGSGLGLAIVREIATRHHATVTLSDAAAGGGLCVTVEFPRVHRGGSAPLPS
jgi:two-component system, OmpR family, sensor kinase